MAEADEPDQARGAQTVSRLVERLAELRRHLDHLRGLRPRHLDFDRVILALDHLQPVEEFAEAAQRIASTPEP